MDGIKEIMSKNAVTITIWIVGLSFGAFNLWLTSQLAPLSSDIRILTAKVEALEIADEKFVSRQELTDLKDRLVRIETKLDRLAEKP